MSSQACFLPVPKGSDSKFNVALFNYQSSKSNPAILAIVATSKGTSAQIVDERGQKLFYNKNGEKCSFVGQRLSDNRIERGVVNNSTVMTQEEKQDNMIMIVQVPLKVNRPPLRALSMMAPPCPAAPMMMMSSAMSKSKRSSSVNVEDAIVKIGEAEGEYKEIGGLEIERDPSFPVRVTLQFYKCTDNGEVNEEVMSVIAKQLEDSRKKADFIGSLVLNPNTGRPTEHKQHNDDKKNLRVPPWWSNFWLTFGPIFPQYNEERAKQHLFANGRFADSSLNLVQDEVISLLGAGDTKVVPPAPPKPVPVPVPVWDIPCQK